MQYAVTYSKQRGLWDEWYRSAKPDVTPYEDWVEGHKRHTDTIFMYSNWNPENAYFNMYLPGQKLAYIRVRLDYYYADCVMRVAVDEAKKEVLITRAATKIKTTGPDYTGGRLPRGKGGPLLSHKLLYALSNTTGDEKGPAPSFIREFFGEGWQMVWPGEAGSLPNTIWGAGMKHRRRLEHWSEELFDDMRRDKTVAIYDFERAEWAVKIIEAVWHGWKARMEYRFNPKTRLGRYLALKMYEEAALKCEEA